MLLRALPFLVGYLLMLTLSGCDSSPSDSDLVQTCFEHVQADPKSVEAMPGLPDSTLDTTETNAEPDGDGYIAVGKAKSGGGVIEFGCEMDSNGNVVSSRVGPEGSIDRG